MVNYKMKIIPSSDNAFQKFEKNQIQIVFLLFSFGFMIFCFFIRYLVGDLNKNFKESFTILGVIFSFVFFGMLHELRFDFIKIYNLIISVIQKHLS